jgi:hypothetical protein
MTVDPSEDIEKKMPTDLVIPFNIIKAINIAESTLGGIFTCLCRRESHSDEMLRSFG